MTPVKDQESCGEFFKLQSAVKVYQSSLKQDLAGRLQLYEK